MKSLVFLTVVAAAFAAPQRGSPDAAAQIIRLDSDVQPDGTFTYSYETSNQIRGEARGEPRVPGPEGNAVAIQGQFSFVADDGQTYAVQYTADENGYQPAGAHLPTPPPIPPEILKSLEFNRQNPEPEEGAPQAPRRFG